MRLEGANVLITGGSSGIGLATAKAIAAKGANIGILARDEAKLATAREVIEAARKVPDQRIWCSRCDVVDFDDVTATVERFEAEVGPVNVLVNSAGIFLPGYFESMPMEWFREHLDINVLGVIHTCRAVAPGMIERKHGHIVNVASMAGFMSLFGYTAYGTAKYAVIGFSEALRSEMKPHGIGISVICPPDVETPGLATERSLRPEETHQVAGNIKPIAPEKVATDIVRAIEAGKYFVVTGMTGKVFRFAKSWVPHLYFVITDSDVAKARKKRLGSE